MLNEHKNFYCQSCLKIIKNEKNEANLLERFRVEYPLQSEEVKS